MQAELRPSLRVHLEEMCSQAHTHTTAHTQTAQQQQKYLHFSATVRAARYKYHKVTSMAQRLNTEGVVPHPQHLSESWREAGVPAAAAGGACDTGAEQAELGAVLLLLLLLPPPPPPL